MEEECFSERKTIECLWTLPVKRIICVVPAFMKVQVQIQLPGGRLHFMRIFTIPINVQLEAFQITLVLGKQIYQFSVTLGPDHLP